MNSKPNKKLQKLRDKALSQLINFDQQLLQYYKPVNEQQDDLESQDYQLLNDFDDMKNREPNEDGTGRIILTNNRNKIGLLNLSINKQINQNNIIEWIFSYTNIQVEILQLNLKIFQNNKNFYIYDQMKQLDYKLDKDKFNRINAFSIFDILEQFIPKHICTMVVIIDQNLYDPYEKESNIVGRACGNRICVVQYTKDQNEFYSTIMHELLHTFGFDHCYLWDCLMNEKITDCMWLCPNDLEKLKLLNPINNQNRLQSLLKISQKIKISKKQIDWLKNMINNNLQK